ncbi:MAG: DUF5602 domain-containing protein [Candidatus Rokuibacteriota bacterium]
MKRYGLTLALLALGLGVLAIQATPSRAQMTAPPGGDYKKVSGLVALPDFLPGLGTLYVKPATLPAGPFLAYDRDGKLVSTVYMIPLKDIEAHKGWSNLAAAKEKVDHVDMYFNAGHPGVAEPHYHVVIWYVSPEKAAALK